jgi:hypothetical protein
MAPGFFQKFKGITKDGSRVYQPIDYKKFTTSGITQIPERSEKFKQMMKDHPAKLAVMPRSVPGEKHWAVMPKTT